MFLFKSDKNEDRTVEILNKYIDEDFIAYPMAEGKLDRKDLKAIENEMQIKIPDEYRAHLLGEFPGIYLEVKEHIWPRPKEGDVGPFWSFLYGIHTFTASRSSDEWMKIDAVASSYKDISGKLVLPILKVVGDIDIYFYDKDCNIIQYNHEENSFKNVKMSFWELFEREVSELFERKKNRVSANKRWT